MTTIHLGVTEVPYTYGGESRTTGDVADILEAKYHVFEHFFQANQTFIVDQLKDAIAGSLESMLQGRPMPLNAYAAGTSQIETKFAEFLSMKQMDGLGYPGIPTQASLRGVSHRFKRPYKRRAARPSFIDTGLYENSMRVWVD